MELQITVVLLSLIFSAFFSGMEIAFISSDRLRIELQRQQGSATGKILSGFLKNPARFIGTTLIGNNTALVVYGIYIALLLDPLIASILPGGLNPQATDLAVLLIQTILATLIVIFTAEFTPKSLFMLAPNLMLNMFAIPMQIIYIILSPFVYAVVSISRFFIVKVLRLKYREDRPVFGLTDLHHFIENTIRGSHELKVDGNPNSPVLNTKIFTNALEFKTVKVRECMIPRTEVIAVNVESTIDELKESFLESGHSKILIFHNTIDDIIGYCHTLALFKKPEQIRDILSPIIIVPETIPANELMIQFITEHRSIALVVDEFGGTAGIVTMEDIIEEIFGDIQDEHDDEDWVEEQIDHDTFLVSARHEIDYLNEKYNWCIPDGEYETLGGYILSITEDIPQIGDVVEADQFTFIIKSMHENRIDNVQLTIDYSLLNEE
jgi:putative hemolysin